MSLRDQLKPHKAERISAYLRAALFSLSGGGKTFTALELAKGLAKKGERIVVIDAELGGGDEDTPRGSSEKYDFITDFDAIVLPPGNYSPRVYCEALDIATEEGYTIAIVDSLSHAWEGEGGVLNIVDRVAAKRENKGNKWAAWREATPQHNKLVEALLAFPGHLIVTMRAKTEYLPIADDSGKVRRIEKVGLAPKQRDGLEYEFDFVGELDLDHRLTVVKSRFHELELDGMVIDKPSATLGSKIRKWLDGGSGSARPKPKLRKADDGEERELRVEKDGKVRVDNKGKRGPGAKAAMIFKKGRQLKLTREQVREFIARWNREQDRDESTSTTSIPNDEVILLCDYMQAMVESEVKDLEEDTVNEEIDGVDEEQYEDEPEGEEEEEVEEYGDDGEEDEVDNGYVKPPEKNSKGIYSKPDIIEWLVETGITTDDEEDKENFVELCEQLGVTIGKSSKLFKSRMAKNPKVLGALFKEWRAAYNTAYGV